MDQQELFPESTLFPMDFQGATPGDGIIYISSDESMECRVEVRARWKNWTTCLNRKTTKSHFWPDV